MTHRRRHATLALLVIALCCRSVTFAADAATVCRTSKMLAAGIYDLCLLRANARARTGIAPDTSKCDAKFLVRWAKAEAKAAGACPTTGDAAAVQGQVQGDVAALIAALGGGSTTTTSTTTTSVTSTTGVSCGTYPGCGGACPAGTTCWATVSPGPTTACTCLPAVATPCASTGGSVSTGPLCGGACPAGEV